MNEPLGRQIIPELDVFSVGTKRMKRAILKADYIGQRTNPDIRYHCESCKGWQQRAPQTQLRITYSDGRVEMACTCDCHVHYLNLIPAKK